MSLLADTVGFTKMTAIVALMNPLVCLAAFLPHRKNWNRSLGRSLILGMGIGVFAGFFLVSAMEEGLARRVFGAFLICIALAEYLLSRGGGEGLPAWSGLPCGLLGGAFGGAFNIGGPPLVAYCYARPWTKTETVATIQVAFLVGAFLRVVLMGRAGHLSGELVRVSVLLSIPTIAAIWLGSRFLGRVNRDVLRLLAFSVVLVLGLKYLLAG